METLLGKKKFQFSSVSICVAFFILTSVLVFVGS